MSVNLIKPYQENSLDGVCKIYRESLCEFHQIKYDAKLFKGNEDKLFLYYMIQNLGSESLRGKNALYTYLDIFKLILTECKSSIKKSIFSTLKTYLYRHLSLLRVKILINSNDVILHASGNRREEPYVIPNLTQLHIKSDYRNMRVRAKFAEILEYKGLSNELSKLLSMLAPITIIEEWKQVDRIAKKYKIEVVCASVYGLMEDPLLSRIIYRNNSNLYYIQHGGTYGFRHKN